MKQTMLEYVKDYIIDKLEEKDAFKSLYANPSELAIDICSYDLNNGTILMNEDESYKTITEWREESGQYLDTFTKNGILPNTNPFLNPGRFMVILVSYAVADVLSQMACFPKKKFLLTRKLREKILNELDTIERFNFCK